MKHLISSTLGLCLVPLVLGTARGDDPEPLGHGALEAEQRLLPPESFGGAAPVLAVPAHAPGLGPTVRRDVLGYLPYWSYSSGKPYVPLRWDLLTILAWFSVALDADGSVGDYNGWTSATAASIVADAHAHGVKVLVTVTNFDSGDIATIVGTADRRQVAIQTCIDLMHAQDADGVNIDFEFVPKSAKANFVTFMAELKSAVRAEAPNGGDGHVSLAGPAIDWSGAYDYDQLLAQTDGIMVMAYGYHWTRSDPGPLSPLFTGDLWSGKSVAWTIDDYLTFGKAENRGRIIIGLPWYGRSWSVATQAIPGTALGNGTTKTYKSAESEANANGKGWEPVSLSTYYHSGSGASLRQVWYDDGRSFGDKVAYVDERDLGGIGIWALGYEGASSDLWDAIDDALGGQLPTEPGPEASTEDAGEVPPEATVAPDTQAETTAPEEDEDTGAFDPDDVFTPGGSPSARAGPGGRSARLIATTEPAGCASGAAGGPGVVAVLLFAVAALAARRRAARSAVSERQSLRSGI